MSTGLLIIRLLIGVLLVGHGVQKLFGWFGGPGLERTAIGFDRLGFHPPKLMAWIAALGELASGISIASGFLFPAGCAALIGVMINAGAVHFPNGLWIQKQGYEFTMVLGGLAAGLAFTGPGEYSLDHAMDLDLTSARWALAAIVTGSAGGVGTLARRELRRRRSPDPVGIPRPG